MRVCMQLGMVFEAAMIDQPVPSNHTYMPPSTVGCRFDAHHHPAGAATAAALQVGHFHELQQWVAQGGTERLQQLLAATNIKPADWHKAAHHVQDTVFPDYRPRIWWQHGSGRGRGLLCSWNQDKTLPGEPLAWALPQQQQDLGYVLVPLQLQLPGDLTDLDLDVQHVMQLALQEWCAAGHGSWEIFWSDAADPLAQRWGDQGLPFNLQALPTGILHAAAPAAAAPPAEGAAPAAPPAAAAAAAAPPVPLAVPAPVPLAAGFNLQAVLPAVQQQQQQELPGVLAAVQPVQQAMQVQPPPPTPALPLQPNVLLAPQQQQQAWLQQQQQGWVQELELLQQQPPQLQGWVQELELVLAQPLQQQQPPPQLQLQLGPQYLMPILSGPATPAALSEPLQPASETADHPLVQKELMAQTSDASTLMDQIQHLQQEQQPRQKRQKLTQQQEQPAAEQGAQLAAAAAAAAVAVGHVVSARFDTVTGPDDGAAVEVPGIVVVANDQQQQSLEWDSIEALLGEDLVCFDDVCCDDFHKVFRSG
jgi:pyruvate/2-oxoglutarate dehydrogenase complex dihydrolipoamide acyltransferase (E2) component